MTNSPSRVRSAVSIVSRPPPGIASRALTARLMRICSICIGSIRTRPSGCWGTTRSWTFSPISRCSIPRTLAMTSFGSRTSGAMTCRRENVSN